MPFSAFRSARLAFACGVLAFVSVASAFGQSPSYEGISDTALKGPWEMISSAKLSAGGETISSPEFRAEGWYPAHVPGSVLGSLVADSVYQDVFFGRRLENIPDSLFAVPWWYRTRFTLGKFLAGQITRLAFDGVNYRADVWLNGHLIASSDTVKGGFSRFSFDISPWVKPGDNILAVKITRPGPGDLTLGFVDWNPAPPDHNMGIWREVRLRITGPVSVDLPFVRTKVDTATLARAGVTVSASLTNHSVRAVEGVLMGSIGPVRFSTKLTLAPGDTREVTFSPDRYKTLDFSHPILWWPRDLGTPHLYPLKLAFRTRGGVSDTRQLRFGIRSVSDYIDSGGHRGFRLNGRRIQIRGGGWTDPMLLDASPAYEAAGIDYAVHMHLNALRMEGFWGHDQHLYDLCDEKGILLMVGFSCQWEWAHLIGLTKEDQYSAILTPEQNDVAARSWRDQLTWLRNHPSIFLWLYGSDKWPRPSLEKRYLDILKREDPSRPAISSAQEHTSVLTGPSAVKMRGPYDYVPPDYWYVDTTYGGAFGFNTETGPGPEIPVLESLRKMIPADSLWPIGSAWLYHAARGQFHNLTRYNRAMDQRLGKPRDLPDYLRKAQFLNYEGMRAMFEAFETRRFRATGIIQWMYNASWPKLWWQLYDYYLMPTAAFYGARKAGEPLHICYDYGVHTVDVLNNTPRTASGLTATFSVYDFGMRRVLEREIPVTAMEPLSARQVFRVPDSLSLSKTWFLSLALKNAGGTVVSRNFYVLSTQPDVLDEKKSTWYVTPESGYADLTLLQQLPPVKLEVKKQFSRRGDTTFFHIGLSNPSGHLAFMIHLDLKKSQSGHSVVPVFWEDNYISMPPGTTRTVTGYCHTADLDGESPDVTVDGWNTQ